jgi:PAS domain S-box-containing protein
VNPRYRRLTGYDSDELVGRHFTKVVPPEEQAELEHLHEEFMGRRYELAGQWRIVNKDGRTIPILANAAYIIDVDGKPKKVTFVVDVSELEEARHRLEQEIAERKRLEQAREEVERVLRHDLRNPIDGIRTAADYLLQEELDPRAQEFVRLMYDAAIRARNRIDNSLAYTRMQRGEYRVSRERVNVVQLVRDVVKNLKDAQEAYRVFVQAFYRNQPLAARYDVELWGENDFLMDAVSNLVRNAIEASDDGAIIRIEVDDEVQTTDEHPAVAITVHNDREIPEEVRDTLFDAYVTHGKSGGTGLGTYTALLVAQAHDGTITVDTGVETGTTMTLLLPRSRPGELS